ncbi:MAG: ATPase AAA [Trebouxia sp. A1-2]|nr:MAG: ATPase AAA [Trebouxia sp. A1-2]
MFVCLCRNSALPNLAGAAAGAALRDSTYRQASQFCLAVAKNDLTDAAHRASQTETKCRQRAKRSQRHILADRVADRNARAVARARVEQVEAERAAAAEAERAAAAAAIQHARHVPRPMLLHNPADLLTTAAIAINLLGFPIAHSHFLQQEPLGLSQLGQQQPIAPGAGSQANHLSMRMALMMSSQSLRVQCSNRNQKACTLSRQSFKVATMCTDIRVKILKAQDNCGGSASVIEVQIAEGAHVMMQRNMCTADGLVNGAMGTVVGFERSQGVRQPGQQPTGICVKFDNARVGQITRELDGQGVDPGPTTVRPATARFSSENGRFKFERYQYPLVLAWAVSFHRVQGVSLDRAVIDLGSNVFAHGQADVPLSRVRTLEGVLLTALSRESFHLNLAVVHNCKEYVRLAGHPIQRFDLI